MNPLQDWGGGGVEFQQRKHKLKQQVLNLPEIMRDTQAEILELVENRPKASQPRVGRDEMGANEEAVIEYYDGTAKHELIEGIDEFF